MDVCDSSDLVIVSRTVWNELMTCSQGPLAALHVICFTHTYYVLSCVVHSYRVFWSCCAIQYFCISYTLSIYRIYNYTYMYCVNVSYFENISSFN